jgi:hypothetical protein
VITLLYQNGVNVNKLELIREPDLLTTWIIDGFYCSIVI